MSASTVVVRRSPWKVLGVALLGVPLVFLVVDYVWGVIGIFDTVIGWAYGTKEVEPFEPRDDILAAVLGLVGGGMVVFGLKELIAPRRVFAADDEGMTIPLSGPFGRRSRIGWIQVDDLESESNALRIHVSNAGGMPDDPWGARWDGDRTLRIPTRWWDRSPDWVIDEVARLGLTNESRARREAMAIEEARAHAAAVELVAGAPLVADPTEDASSAEGPPRDGDEPSPASGGDEPTDAPPDPFASDADDTIAESEPPGADPPDPVPSGPEATDETSGDPFAADTDAAHTEAADEDDRP